MNEHEMTFSEYRQSHVSDIYKERARLRESGILANNDQQVIRGQEHDHRMIIVRAIAAGKRIPTNVWNTMPVWFVKSHKPGATL